MEIIENAICIDVNIEGLGIVKSGMFNIYVPNLLKDEVADIKITYKNNKYMLGVVEKFIKKSKDRVVPPCSVYSKCGGCNIQHMSYESQLKYKKDCVAKLFKKADIDIKVHDTVGMDSPFCYRNKVQTPVGYLNSKLAIGFFKENTHEIVEFDNCLVQDEYSNKIVKLVKLAMKENKIPAYDEDKKIGVIRHLLIRRAHSSNETMLVLVTKQDSFPGRNNFLRSIREYLPELTTIVQNINTRTTNVILGEKENILYGKGYIMDNLCGINFKISPKSFYQINKIQTEKLYTKAIELANISSNDVVLDAYCGIGTIGLIASKKAKRIIGVEIIESAVKDARMNARSNNINNATFYLEDCTEFMNNFNEAIDIVFVDPPRKGCSYEFLESLLKLKPKKIVYISCNPISLVDDIKVLLEDYEINEAYPYDMFPMTDNIETVVLLSRA